MVENNAQRIAVVCLFPSESKSKISSRQGLVLIVLLCVGAFLRFYDIGGPSLWADEIWSIEISTGRGSAHDLLPLGSIQTEQVDLTSLDGAAPWWKIWTTMSLVVHPPLYHIALRWWMDGLGNSAGAVRSLSALLSVALVLVFFDVCRLLHGTQIALWAAALMTFSVAQVEFAQDARSYAMLMLLALLACDAVIRIELGGASAPKLIALGIFLAAAQLTHYFAALAIVGLGVYVLVRLRGRDRLLTLGAFAAAGIFFAVVWGPELLAQRRSLPQVRPEFLQNHSASPVATTLGYLVSLPGQFFCGDIFYILHPQAAVVATVAGAIIFVAAVIYYLMKRRRDMLIWMVWFCAVVAPLAIVDIGHRASYLQYLRYSILASPAVYAMVGAFRRPVVMVALAGCVCLMVTRAVVGVPARGDMRLFADLVEKNVAPDQVVAIYSHDPFVGPGIWYMGLRYYQPESNRPWLLLREPIDDQLQSQLHARGSLWLVTVQPGSVARTIVPGWNPVVVLTTPVAYLYELVPATASGARP
jgi:uncharacterized membrane protein